MEAYYNHALPASENSLGMLALAVSADRQYLAVSERGERGTITVYSLLEKNRRKHVLCVEDAPVQEFVYLAFSHDCKYLIGQSGPPDWVLFCWTLRKPHVIAKVKSGALSYPINQVTVGRRDGKESWLSCYCFIIRVNEDLPSRATVVAMETVN